MALKNKQPHFWTLGNFRTLLYHLKTASYRYFYCDAKSYVTWKTTERFSVASF